jgi:hypothetical protein
VDCDVRNPAANGECGASSNGGPSVQQTLSVGTQSHHCEPRHLQRVELRYRAEAKQRVRKLADSLLVDIRTFCEDRRPGGLLIGSKANCRMIRQQRRRVFSELSQSPAGKTRNHSSCEPR